MAKHSLSIRGFTRAQLVDSKTGRILGDSGWVKNKIQKTGFENMIVHTIALGGSSSSPRRLALGNQTGSIASNNMSSFNSSHVGSFVTPTTSLITTTEGATLRLEGTFVGTAHSPNNATINAIAMFNTNNSSTILAGTTFSQSSWANDQDVRVTYELRFSQT